MSFRIISALVLISSMAASAEEAVNRFALKPEIQRGDVYDPKGFWPLLGVGVGLTDDGGAIRSGGVPAHVKLLGSYYFESIPWVADVGLGFHNEVLTQNGEGSDSIQSLYTEVAARYKLPNRWQIGGLWNTLLDNPDRYQSNTSNLASFIGVQALKEFTWDGQYVVRLGGRAMTDIGISGTTVDTVMGELQVSFGPNAPSEVAEQPVEVSAPTPIAPHLAARAIQTYTLDPGPVNFDTDSVRLIKVSDAYLKRLARALALNRQLFDRVEVVGHADQRGSDQYNMVLSQRRARAISDKLVAAGVNQSQISSVGRGRRELLSNSMNPTALLRNRRVELEFQGVKNQEALKNILDAVKE
jgi:outer membrane protein OmpA-like peptidoglycan-associated protein